MNSEARDVLILFGIAAVIVGIRWGLNRYAMNKIPRCPSCGAEMQLAERTAHHKRWVCDCGQGGAQDFLD